ncbi:MAG: GGDEF domain-containing protein, partial [Eubacteriales bacterium]|nr:GGDEF domain-containing protein [Eubacteriales bacterium]
TELPGSAMVERALQRMLSAGHTRCVLYFDMDNFKAYNDVYGFESGDRLIKHLANIIRSEINGADFVGHLGGDDFVAIVDSTGSEDVCRRILDAFDGTVAGFYTKQDTQNGYVIAKTPHGYDEQHQLVSLSIAGVLTAKKPYCTPLLITEEAGRIKKKCKQVTGSVFIIS